MDEHRARVYEDLRDLVDGELFFGPLDRAPYAHDASLFELDPLGVVAPHHEDDVATVARYALEHRIPLHARGAGTDTGGGSLGTGLVLDLSRHFRRVWARGEDRVEVEAGAVADDVNAVLAPLGRRLAPALRDRDVATMGGLIAVDAAGGRSLDHGSMGEQVERLRAVLAGGETVELGREPWPDLEAEPANEKERIVRRLQLLHRAGGERPGRAGAPAPALRDRAGYALARAADESGIHLGRLVAGSEGTLALIARAVLRTVPAPAAQAVVLLSFPGLVQAAAIVPELFGSTSTSAPSACDLIDRRSLRHARGADPFFRQAVDDAAEAVLLVEFEGEGPAEALEKARIAGELAGRHTPLIAAPSLHGGRGEAERLLSWRRLVEPFIMRPSGRPRPIAVFDDVAVPPDRLADVLKRLQALFQRRNITWSVDAHAGEGRLRSRPFLDLADADAVEALEPLTEEVYAIVLDAGGTISSSQSCGLLRTPFLRAQFGAMLPTFREIKDAFDPLGQLNPGKVVGAGPHWMVQNLRRSPLGPSPLTAEPASGTFMSPALETEGPFEEGPSGVWTMAGPAASAPVSDTQPALATASAPVLEGPSIVGPALIWPGAGMLENAAACHGCGACRGTEPTRRMCPAFRAQRDETASPRAQANLIRQLAIGAIDPRLWGSDELKAHADLCIHCKVCRLECPSSVDVSSLMIEAKAACVERHGLPPSDWIFSRLDFWARLGTIAPAITNALFHGRRPRWLLERLLGVSRHRVLPRVRRGAFVRRAARMGLHRPRPQRPGPRVAYFLDVFANHFDQELAEAVVAVLRHAGVNVFVPPRQRGCGMASLVVGDIDHARELARANIRALANAVRDGYTIVCSEPTAALMLREEYVKLTEDLDAELVARNTLDLGQYLLGLDARGQLPAPREPLHARAGYHQPCHLRALQVGTPGLELLRKVPGLSVEFIDRGCSGMGGTYGLSRDHFRNSLRAGRGLIQRFRGDDIEIGATECAACRIQMEQGSPKRTLHPMKLLSMSYGLAPMLRPGFKEPKPKNAMS